MANFYNSENILTDIAYEFPCEYEEITLKGLKEGELLISYNPSFIQNTDGNLVGIDSRFDKFYVIDSSKKVLKILELRWTNNCQNNLVETTESRDIRNDYSIFILVSIIFILTIIKTIRRRYESY